MKTDNSEIIIYQINEDELKENSVVKDYLITTGDDGNG
jgi:hypothetical protein